MSLNTQEKVIVPTNSIDINDILSLVDKDMVQVNKLIEQNLDSDVALINQLGAYIIQAGGKRLRPVALLLSAKALNNSSSGVTSSTIKLAAIIEFIHTATLLHDDVVDESEMRRGRETANEVWGNAASVLVGDYLYSRSFQMMVNVGNMRVMEILSHTTNQIAEGEVMQLINCGSPETTEEQYIQTIQSKTAILFEAATQLAAVASNQNANTEQMMAAYGLHLGTAFQLVDDILDYTADAETMGKNIGDDLAEGKPTLPIIYAISQSKGNEKALLEKAITDASRDNIEQVLSIIHKTGALKYTADKAQQQVKLAQQAISSLPDSVYKGALLDLASFSIQRKF